MRPLGIPAQRLVLHRLAFGWQHHINYERDFGLKSVEDALKLGAQAMGVEVALITLLAGPVYDNLISFSVFLRENY
jgi:hypothetical protein